MFRVSMGILGPGNPEDIATVVKELGRTFPTPPFEVEFTGGSIRLKNITDRIQGNYALICPNLDSIIFDVTTTLVMTASSPVGCCFPSKGIGPHTTNISFTT